ncbi:MAG TPA: arylesterase [Kofleriaceae bacterium]
MRIAIALLLTLTACKSGDDPGRAAPPAAPPVDRRPAVVFLGDSLTAGLGLSADEAVPARIAARIDQAGLPLRVVNGGRSGDTSAGGLARLAWYLRPDVGMAALVVNLGSNDALRGLSLVELEKNLTAIVTRAKTAAPSAPVLLVALETFPNMGDEFTAEYRAIFPRVAQATGAVLVPFPLREVALDPALVQPDGVHPNAAGAEKMAATMWPTLEPVLRRVGARPAPHH